MLRKRTLAKMAALAMVPALLALSSGKAEAELFGDSVKPFVSLTETYESNVFRVRDQNQLQALVRDRQMGDFITVATAGTRFHYGLNSLQSNVLLKHDYINYSHYSNQSANRDEMGGDASIRLLDRVTVRADGSWVKEPQPRADFRAPGLNYMNTLQYGVLVGYEMKSGLGFEGGYRRIGVGYSLAELKPREYDMDRYSGTVYYRLSPEAKVYATIQRENRAYRAEMPLGDEMVKNDNTADSVRVGMEKVISPKTAVSGYLGYTNRKHSAVKGRDYSGLIGKAEARYAVTSKIGVVVNGERQLYEETYRDQDYSVNTSAGAGVVYQVSEKVKASLMDKVTWKDYQSLPGTAAPKRNDVTNQVSAGVEWTPRRRVTVNVGYQLENRSSSDSSYKFTNHGITAGVAYKF